MDKETLRGHRLALGKTQKSFADFLKISLRQYARYETGESLIPGPVGVLIGVLIDKRLPRLR